MEPQSEPCSSGAHPAPRRRWLMRFVAMLLPLALLAAVELSMRLTGCYSEDDGAWQNRHVEFEKDTVFFPAWKDQMSMPKPEGTFRVFVLGGSTTVGLGVQHAYPEFLAAELTSRFEVVNGGVAAAGSHRVFEVLKEAAHFDPDVALISVGNNEFLEEVFFAPDSILGKQQRVTRFARQFRIMRWMAHVFDFSGWAHRSFRRARLQQHFLGSTKFPLIRTPEQYKGRLAFLESNLDLMASFAAERRFRIVLMPEVANLMVPPGDSFHGPGFLQPEKWATFMEEGRRCLEQGDADGALAVLRQASALDPAYAMTHFGIAKALIAKGDYVEARKELDLANTLDRRGDRINADIRRTIADVARRTGTPLLDMQEDVYGQPVDVCGPFGQKLFLDHCHLTEAGHRIMSQSILRFLTERKLVPDPAGR